MDDFFRNYEPYCSRLNGVKMEFTFIAKILSVINSSISLLKELWKLFQLGRSRYEGAD